MLPDYCRQHTLLEGVSGYQMSRQHATVRF